MGPRALCSWVGRLRRLDVAEVGVVAQRVALGDAGAELVDGGARPRREDDAVDESLDARRLELAEPRLLLLDRHPRLGEAEVDRDGEAVLRRDPHLGVRVVRGLPQHGRLYLDDAEEGVGGSPARVAAGHEEHVE
eukprot:265806-Prymnesium_polylepis.1